MFSFLSFFLVSILGKVVKIAIFLVGLHDLALVWELQSQLYAPTWFGEIAVGLMVKLVKLLTQFL